MNKKILKSEPDLDFTLIAITAPLKDYRFCFKVNKQLNIEFYRVDELQLVFNSDEGAFYFSKYYYQDKQTGNEYFLLANKGSESFLIPEMKTVDYFLLIYNFIDKEDLKGIIAGLNKINEVLVAAEVDPKKLKSKENLVF
ncbi:MAG TPA: IPExxxVDY family protein [Sphingobacteriaceae bacterium]|nr:IPExxxVDY family protein [Sphingobacteriaceae bacterium]